MGSFTTAGNYRDADPRLVAIAQAAAARSPYNVVLFSGARENNTRSQHHGGNAIDIVLVDPQSGREIPNLGAGGEAFAAYESFARTMREAQQQIAPDLSGNFRWGGYFGPTGLNSTGLDLMHFDLGPTQNMALGTWEGGLNERGRTFVAQAGAGQTYSATQGPGSQRPSSTMAYAPSGGTPAGQNAITAATGPAAGLPAPAPAPGSQPLFRSRADAIAAREAGGTPRLDELSNIIQQRRAGMNPLLERLQNFIQTRRAARQEDQAPTPPAPIPANAARPAGGGGGASDQTVAQLQQQLRDAGFDPGAIDGQMGPRTRAAITAFQQARGLQADGIAGPQTRAALAQPQQSPPLPNPNVARPGVAPAGPAAQANLNYRIPVTPAAPTAITAPQPGSLTTGSMTPMNPPPPAARANLDYGIPIAPASPTPISGPAPGSLTTGSLTPMTPPGPAARANLNFGIPIQPRNPAAVPTPSANPTLGPMLAGYNTPGNGVGVPTTPVSRGVLPDAAPPAFPRATAPTLRPPQGALPPMQTPPPWGTEPMPPATLQRAAWSPDPSVFDPARVVASMPQASLSAPGWGGGMPAPMPNPTTLVANTGTPFPREDAVNRGFMPAGRDDFGIQNGFFRDLPGFNDQNPNIMAPQALSGAARPVTTTTPTMPNMPLRGLPIPPWWRQFMGAGV